MVRLARRRCLLLLLTTVPVLLAAYLWWQVECDAALIEADFDRVTMGVTFDGAVQLFGPPTHVTRSKTESDKDELWAAWDFGHRVVGLWWVDGALYDKRCQQKSHVFRLRVWVFQRFGVELPF